MKIQVTREHLQSGVPGKCDRDPIALALLSAGFHDPWVTPFRIHTQELGDVETPVEVLDFMFRFDNHGFTEPFEFELTDET